MSLNNMPRRAHRISWLIANGSLPVNKWVLHRCNNPRCVRPDHLYLGTAKQNVADMLARKDYIPPNAKLNKSQAREIRQSYPQQTLQSLAIRFGCHKSTIWLIVKNKIWRSA